MKTKKYYTDCTCGYPGDRKGHEPFCRNGNPILEDLKKCLPHIDHEQFMIDDCISKCEVLHRYHIREVVR